MTTKKVPAAEAVEEPMSRVLSIPEYVDMRVQAIRRQIVALQAAEAELLQLKAVTT